MVQPVYEPVRKTGCDFRARLLLDGAGVGDGMARIAGAAVQPPGAPGSDLRGGAYSGRISVVRKPGHVFRNGSGGAAGRQVATGRSGASKPGEFLREHRRDLRSAV